MQQMKRMLAHLPCRVRLEEVEDLVILKIALDLEKILNEEKKVMQAHLEGKICLDDLSRLFRRIPGNLNLVD